MLTQRQIAFFFYETKALFCSYDRSNSTRYRYSRLRSTLVNALLSLDRDTERIFGVSGTYRHGSVRERRK